MSEVGEPTAALSVVAGVLQALATGTFIFVTFFEIMRDEVDPRHTTVGKLASALAGFTAMSLLVVIPVLL